MSNFTKLSRTEMKRVLGGNMPLPGDCSTGQSLYYCYSSGSCTQAEGYGCGASTTDANNQQVATWRAEGVWGDCYNTVSCGLAD